MLSLFEIVWQSHMKLVEKLVGDAVRSEVFGQLLLSFQSESVSERVIPFWNIDHLEQMMLTA